ncbi:Trk system potassium transporter TrkA [Saezia sanguinis]|uniref:Trk system potassium transporter TrkA n=1 Tax=Saezia sanguinis TaxID=1965230 RepID=UPI00305D9551
MNIIIIGAGRVGESVAENLLSEDNEITVIDNDSERLRSLQERFDLRGVQGNGTEIDVLIEAGARDAELLISCASLEETNLVACKIAQMVFNIPTRIARVRSSHLDHQDTLLSKDGFAVDTLICPEESLSRYIAKLVEYPQALQVRNFAEGLACLVSVRARAGSPLVRHSISEVTQIMPNIAMRIVAIYRRLWDGPDQLIMTDGSTRIEPDDEVFVLAAKDQIPAILNGLHQLPGTAAPAETTTATEETAPLAPVSSVRPQRIMIAGGGRVGERLAMYLAASPINHNLKVIEKNPDRCITLASKLKESVLVLQGNATDEDLLESENVANIDLFLSVTHDDEDNIMSALLAKRMGARRVLALINRRSYAELMHSTQIDIALSPAQTMLGELLAHVRKGEVIAVHSLRRGVAEALEIVARGTRKTSRVIGRQLGDLKLPAGVQVGLIIRGLSDGTVTPDSTLATESGFADSTQIQDNPQQTAQTLVQLPNAQVIIPSSHTVIENNDHIVLFLPSKRLIRDVEKLFKVGATFL